VRPPNFACKAKGKRRDWALSLIAIVLSTHYIRDIPVMDREFEA